MCWLLVIFACGAACASRSAPAHVPSASTGTSEASASPGARCYEGTEKGTETTGTVGTRFVLERELDPTKHEIREHLWRETNPTSDVTVTFYVADDGKTFTWETVGRTGTGTLDGPAWNWTASHSEGEARGTTSTRDETFTSDGLTVAMELERAAEIVKTAKAEAKLFDCSDLATRRAALDDTAPDATRTCYDGQLVVTPEGKTMHIVIAEILEPKRVQMLMSYPGHPTGRLLFAIDGSTITVKNTGRSWAGVGTIGGPAGAWTSYEYKMTIEGTDLTIDGTLGGPHFTEITKRVSPRQTITETIKADAFDCKDLAQRQAALQ